MSEAINTVGGVRTIPGGIAVADIAIRPMEERDIPRAVEIESAIMGPKKSTTLRGSLTAYLSKGERNACLVAEAGGKVVGFLVGDIRAWTKRLDGSGSSGSIRDSRAMGWGKRSARR